MDLQSLIIGGIIGFIVGGGATVIVVSALMWRRSEDTD